MEKDLTSGSVLKNIFTFSLPYLLSYFLQTLYGMADLFIIGRFEGVASTTAVSIGSQVMHMLTVMLVGVAMGTTVCIGRSVGAGDKQQAAKVIGNTVTLFMVGSVVLAAALVGLVDPIVRLISTPEEAVAGTAAYLTICFIGIPCITAYNVLASIFRGMGDSRSPMYFIAAACVVNIGLDFFFMGALRLGPAGAALGTTLSQAVSVLLALCVILKRRSIRLSKSDFCPRKATMKDILSIGLPVAAQDGFIQVSFMLITIMANQRGPSPPMRLWCWPVRPTSAATSSTACSRASSSASAAISAPGASRGCRFCTTPSPSCWCVCRAHGWPAGSSPRPSCRWVLPRPAARCSPASSASCSTVG